jgi:poly(ADP-ribose) glycohydrolase ARH3
MDDQLPYDNNFLGVDEMPFDNSQEAPPGAIDGNSDKADRFVGCLLGAMVGDAMGAAVEGMNASGIQRKYGAVTDFIAAPHMGIKEEGDRFGMYTDDTNSMLALAQSLVLCGGLNALNAAQLNAQQGLHSIPLRGYPDSAIEVMEAVEKGVDIRETGQLRFKMGKYSNGGAMRIAPVGLCFGSCGADALHEAVCIVDSIA